MKTYPTTPRLLLAGLLFSGCLQVATATPPAPAPKTGAAKPKLAPRPIPGMAGSSAPAPMPAMATPARKMASVASAAAPAGSGPEQAHIVMIYRRGSAALPATAALPSAAKHEPDIVQPVNMATAPRDGEVRIITKEEADKFAAKPEL
jgi:hypothetical protein